MSGWNGIQGVESRKYTCGFCGNLVASSVGLRHNNPWWKISICSHCDSPSFFLLEMEAQVPGVAPGSSVRNVPDSLNELYEEARRCCSVNAFTASVLATRKMLMNIAVDKGAQEGLKFIQYVNHLDKSGFIPPNGKGWVDHIRDKGNDATHEIALMKRNDAEDLITFCEMLLKFIYEFPARVPVKAPKK